MDDCNTFNIGSSWKVGPATAVSEALSIEDALLISNALKSFSGEQHSNAGSFNLNAVRSKLIAFQASVNGRSTTSKS
jgi:hypothetical protein